MRRIARHWITADSPVLMAVNLHPGAQRVFAAFGMPGIKTRIAPSQSITIRQAARMLGCPGSMRSLLKELNALIEGT